MIVQACSECDRQYDVSHLEGGRRVRCVCDKLLTVKRQRELPVTAHKCTNCGGTVGPADERCPYCAAALSPLDRARSMLCPACMTRLDDDSRHCSGCGIEIRPQALAPLPEDRTCPRCSSELQVRSLAEASVVECGSCQGMWVLSEMFTAICQRAQREGDVSLHPPRELPVKASEPERKVRYIPCLTCGEMMLRKAFRYRGRSSHVVVDYCKHHGIWFDNLELVRILEFVRSRANADPAFDLGGSLSANRPARGRPPLGPDAFPAMGSRSELVFEGLGWFLAGALADLFD